MPEMKTLTINDVTYDIVDDTAVKFTEQTLSEEQKAQAIENIGAVNKTSVEHASLTHIYFNAHRDDVCFETTDGDGLYINIPENWWIRGSVDNNATYASVCPDNRATSPNGVSDCIHVGHNQSLVFDINISNYSIINTSDLNINTIPIFSVGRMNNVECISGGIGLYYYETYKNSVHQSVWFTMESRAYFEEGADGLYVRSKSMDDSSQLKWFMLGIEQGYDYWSQEYSTICASNRATSPNGIADCIFIPKNKELVYDRGTKQYKIQYMGRFGSLNGNSIPIFVTGHTTDDNKYGVVGGIGLHEYQNYVAKRKYNYAKSLSWELGSLSPGAGHGYDSTYRVRSDYVLVGKGTKLTVAPDWMHLIYTYDLNKVYQSDISWTDKDIVVEQDCYIRILVRHSQGWDVTNYVEIVSNFETVEYVHPLTIIDVSDNSNDSDNLLPSVFIDQYTTAKETIQNNRLQAGNNGMTFIWLTDLHWQNNHHNSPNIVKYVAKDLNIRNIVLTGDYIGGGDHDTNIDLMRDCIESFVIDNTKMFNVVGNHDYNIYGSPDETHYLTVNEVENLVAGNVDEMAVFGNGCYYYYDIPKNRTRMIFLDSATDNGEYITMDEEQITWLNTALETAPSNYRILVFQHIIYGATEWSAPLLEKLVLCYQGEAVISACDTHNAKGGSQVVAIFGGHIHLDYNTTSASGIPIIMMDSDSKQTYSGLGSAQNTVNSQCIDVVTVDYDNNKISCVRIGRGADRVITWTA
jgi:hypothetical protein